jgi:UDP-3-O-[3-hydroxymyristoyl] glucosamine N-acyltransferase
MAGHSGLAGSVTLGDGVIIGGSASIKDHTTLGSGAIGAGSGVVSDVPAGKTLGYPAVEARDALKQWAIKKDLLTNLRSKRIDFIIFIKKQKFASVLCLKNYLGSTLNSKIYFD